ncbi:MAG: hypothetical protein ACE5OP_02870 [Candidatus Glassbacteria bacterium]
MKEGNRPNKKRVRISTLFLLSELFIVNSLFTAEKYRDFDLNLSISPDSLFIGDELSLTVELIHEDSLNASLMGINADLAPFEVVGGGEVKTSRIEGARLDSLSLSLTSYETGEHFLGPIQVLISVDEQPDTITIEGKSVYVKSLLGPDAQDIKEIKGMIPPSRRRLLIWLLLGLIPLAILTCIVLIRRKNRAQRAAAEIDEKPSVPPDVWALDELLRIERMELLSRGKVKKYYILVSEILRRYASMRFKIVTLERTTREILEDLRSNGMKVEHHQAFSNLLEESDLVKFAKWTPAASTSESYIERVREIIRDTCEEKKEEEVHLAVR